MHHKRNALYGMGAVIVALAAIITWKVVQVKNTNKAVVLQREWTANAEFAGDAWAASIAREGGRWQLEVREGSELIDPIKMVRSELAQFGVASADRILRENEGGANLVVIAAATYRSPVVFLSTPDSRIGKPQDFRGKTVGIQAGTNTELVFHSLLRAQNIPVADIKVVESGWGTTNFETGVIDVLAAFAYDEPVTLEKKGKPFVLLSPEDYGVKYVGTVYFTRRSLIEDEPTVVQDFMNALVSGWTHALGKPDEAMRILVAAFPALAGNLAKEQESLHRGRPYFSGEDGQLLYASQSRWDAMAKDLISLGRLKSFDFVKTVDYRFLDRARQ